MEPVCVPIVAWQSVNDTVPMSLKGVRRCPETGLSTTHSADN